MLMGWAKVVRKREVQKRRLIDHLALVKYLEKDLDGPSKPANKNDPPILYVY